MSKIESELLGDHIRAAEILWQARRTGIPCEPIRATFPNFTIEDAYKVSGEVFAKNTALGNTLVGRKIGLTSRAVQAQLGVSEPDYGFLTQEMHSNGVLSRGSLIQGKAEGEVAFVLGSDLDKANVSELDVKRATVGVCACIEVIDSRIKEWKISIVDTVADNASSAFFCLGETVIPLDSIDIQMLGMTLWKNGEIESTGVGVACMGSPLKSVTWLANKAYSLGMPLKKGEIVLSGALGPVVSLNSGDFCEVEIRGLGKVSVKYE